MPLWPHKPLFERSSTTSRVSRPTAVAERATRRRHNWTSWCQTSWRGPTTHWNVPPISCDRCNCWPPTIFALICWPLRFIRVVVAYCCSCRPSSGLASWTAMMHCCTAARSAFWAPFNSETRHRRMRTEVLHQLCERSSNVKRPSCLAVDRLTS